MKIEFLWHFNPARTYLGCLVFNIIAVFALSHFDTRPQSVASIMVIIGGILAFVFLSELPSGHWSERLFLEILHFLASAMLFVLGIALLILFAPERISLLEPIVLRTFSGIALVSHIAVRVFARVSAQWTAMRRRRLLWDITHAQLRLVLLTMLILFILLMIINLATNDLYRQLQTSDFVVNTISLLIAVGGFFGIMTGVLLFIVLIPASLLSYFTARGITRRLDNLIQVTHEVREQRYDARAQVAGEDEISQLQADFNHMMDDLVQARSELERERDAVRQLLEARQQLFANVSHELRTPVAIIRSYLETLTSSDNADKIDIIERETLRLQHLIDDVFTLARADVNQLPYQLEPTEISPILESCVQALKQQAWQSKKVDVVLAYQPQIPLVIVDAKRVEQIIMNLLRNAVRHTSPGGLIRVSVASDTKWVCVAVHDTGEGIASDDLPHIWDRFYRSAENRANDSTGSGLGLALVQEMVTAMLGDVSVQSEVGRGSCFMVKLPRIY
ncbi:MAG: ATP-binding protein [Chloroflexota bacterium]